MNSQYIVTAAPPTPNGDLHLGHLAGPYSGADILTRACRLAGADTLFVTGSDLHQSYVPVKARRDGADPLTMADSFADEIERIFASAGFAPDACVRPQHSARHIRIVREFFIRLHERGALHERTEQAAFCRSCERYLFEAHLTGKCPHCGARCDGNSCENCARPNSCTDLIDAVCNACGAEPEPRLVRRLVLPLSEYADRLRSFHAAATMSPQLEALCAQMLAVPLPDIPVSHPTDWGISVPIDGFEDQRIYVWAEMLPGYFAALAQALADNGGDPDDWQARWNDPGTQVVQFFGFDNGYFHAILQPALLMAYDPEFKLPAALLTNEFYQLGTSKFSTSRRHAIWASDLLAAAPASTVRFVLAYDRPEVERTSFGWDRFRGLSDGILVGIWQDWLTDLFARIETYGDGRIPVTTRTSRSHEAFIRLIGRIAQDCLDAYTPDAFSPRRAARLLCELVICARDFAAGQSRVQDGAAAAAAAAAEAVAARTLAQLAYPLMPTFAELLWGAIGERGAIRWDGVRRPAAGQLVDTSTRFFQPLPGDLEQAVMTAA
jgi:methionyl-tRNA synthetase